MLWLEIPYMELGPIKIYNANIINSTIGLTPLSRLVALTLAMDNSKYIVIALSILASQEGYYYIYVNRMMLRYSVSKV